MIRGTIEQISESRISGWLYSEIASVRDRLVLAFVDDQCIGSGRINLFREDLAKAGLADGMLGFQFPIVLPSPTDRPRVTVRLEGSDAVLLQRASRVISGEASTFPAVSTPPRSLSSMKWMLAQGWIDQSGYDFLKYLEQFGVYERTLQTRPLDVAGAAEESFETASQLLQMYYLDEVNLHQHKVLTPEDLAEVAANGRSINGCEPIVALWSSTRTRLGVIEGSHRRPIRREHAPTDPGSIDYEIAPLNLVFINLRCSFTIRGELTSDGIIVFSANGTS